MWSTRIQIEWPEIYSDDIIKRVSEFSDRVDFRTLNTQESAILGALISAQAILASKDGPPQEVKVEEVIAAFLYFVMNGKLLYSQTTTVIIDT